MEQITSFLISAAGFLFIFGVVVLVHELGHFLAAKATGVYAPRFSIGFGPGPKKRWGETQYQLGVIPLGGYVRMASREDEATAFLEGGSEVAAEREAKQQQALPRDWDPEAMIPFGPKPVPEHRWFESKTLPQKLLIMFAGVSMNALLTVVVLFGLNLSVGGTVVTTRVVGGVQRSPDGDAIPSLIQPGDTIFSVQGVAVSTWNEIERELVMAGGDTITVVTSRGTVSIPAGGPGGSARAALSARITPYATPRIEAAEAGRPAALAGLRSGDLVVAIEGQPVRSSQEMIELVSAAAGRPLNINVLRDSAVVSVSVVPESVAGRDPVTGQATQVGRIGISLPRAESIRESVGPINAFGLALRQTGDMATGIVRTLQGLFQRTVPFRDLGGPITIARASGEAAQQGIVSLLLLLAMLSINLAVLNLLPIPVLDGGQILLVVAESVKGSPFSPRARQVILGTGVALVLLLMIAVSYNDVLRLFGR
jgi:regulator of sigma E protease